MFLYYFSIFLLFKFHFTFQTQFSLPDLLPFSFCLPPYESDIFMKIKVSQDEYVFF